MRAPMIGLVIFVWLMLALAQPASAATINLCGSLEALQRPNPPQVEGPGSVTISGKTYLLSSALSNNNTNTISPAATVGSSVCLSGELVAGTADLVINYVLSVQTAPASGLPSTATSFALAPGAGSADGQIDLCGTLQALSPAREGQPAAQLLLTVGGGSLQYALVGTGTITPPNIASLGTGLNPVRVRVRGVLTESDLSSYAVTQVASCAATLPATSTADQGTAAWWLVLAWVALALAAAARRGSAPLTGGAR